MAILFAASFVPLYSRLGHKYPWQWIFALGGATGLVAALIRGAFGGAVCHPIPVTCSLRRASRRCGTAPFRRAIGRLVRAIVLCVRHRARGRGRGDRHVEGASTAPHHDL